MSTATRYICNLFSCRNGISVHIRNENFMFKRTPCCSCLSFHIAAINLRHESKTLDMMEWGELITNGSLSLCYYIGILVEVSTFTL